MTGEMYAINLPGVRTTFADENNVRCAPSSPFSDIIIWYGTREGSVGVNDEDNMPTGECDGAHADHGSDVCP